MIWIKASTGAVLLGLCAGPAMADTVAVSPATLDKYAGYYQLSPVSDLRILHDGDHLLLMHNGHAITDLAAESDIRFTGLSLALTISFVMGDDGQVQALVLERGPKPRRAGRIDAQAGLAIEKQANSAGVFRAGISPGPLYAASPID